MPAARGEQQMRKSSYPAAVWSHSHCGVGCFLFGMLRRGDDTMVVLRLAKWREACHMELQPENLTVHILRERYADYGDLTAPQGQQSKYYGKLGGHVN